MKGCLIGLIDVISANGTSPSGLATGRPAILAVWLVDIADAGFEIELLARKNIDRTAGQAGFVCAFIAGRDLGSDAIGQFDFFFK